MITLSWAFSVAFSMELVRWAGTWPDGRVVTSGRLPLESVGLPGSCDDV
jgi:hypothetical protein